MRGRGVVDLAPRFRERHPLVVIFGAIVVALFAFIVAVHFSTRAEVSDFYPSTCLGTWQNPSKAAGQPPGGTANLQFSDINSAVLDASGTQIFCGGFVQPGSSSSGTITNVGLTIYWQVGNGTVVPPADMSTGGTVIAAVSSSTPSSTINSSTTNNSATGSSSKIVAPATALTITTTTAKTSATTTDSTTIKTTDIVSSTPSSTTISTGSVASSSLSSPSAGGSSSPSLPLATSSSNILAPSSSTGASVPPPLMATTTTSPPPPPPTVQTTKTSSSSSPSSGNASSSALGAIEQLFSFLIHPAFAENASSSGGAGVTTTAGSDTSTIIIAPPITASLTPVATASGSVNSAATSSTALPAVPDGTPSTPDGNFLEVSYSTDGSTWIPIQKVSESNWKDLTITIPVTDWNDLAKLQIRIAAIPTSLAVLPTVYLDGMLMEIHYDVGPFMGNGASTSINQRQDFAAQAQLPVVVTPSKQFAPTGGQKNFGANQAPTFDFNLNNLHFSATSTGGTLNTATDSSSFSSASSSGAGTATSTVTSTPADTPQSSMNDRSPIPLVAFFLNSPLGAFFGRADAQVMPTPPVPTPQNPVVAEIDDPSGQPTGFQPVISIVSNQLSVGLPEPPVSFVPGRYTLKLWILQNGVIYATENTFTWGVLTVNFDKSIYPKGDTAHMGFAVLDDQGHTLCDTPLLTTVTAPDGTVYSFSTANGTIAMSKTCGPATVTNAPDYFASLAADQIGTYNVSVTATTPNGARTITDQFEVQDPPLFDVMRNAPTRIYPPVPYSVAIAIKANANYNGPIVETIPASFIIMGGNFLTRSPDGTFQTLVWQAKLKKGDSMALDYVFKAPDVSPELYKLGPLQIGTWTEARQWAIAADAIATKQIFITSTASTTWTVPSDWNSASNTIEIIGGGGGGGAGAAGQGAGGGGAGGGAYAAINDFSAAGGALVKIQVGAAGGFAANGKVTYFNWNGSGSTSTCSGTTMSICAAAGSLGSTAPGSGSGAAGGSGGTTAGSVGTTINAGGNGNTGGNTGGSNGGAGGGGGGAAGASAVGNNGTAGAQTTAGTGGQGDGTAGGAGGAADTGGSNGTEWSITPAYGSGGGGGGASGPGRGGAGSPGGVGGTYGAGGGGGSGAGKAGGAGGAGGAGNQGIIVITYTPAGIILGDGTEPAPVTVGPGANATTSDAFTFMANFGTSTITNVTTTLSTVSDVGLVEIANAAGTTIYGSSANLVATSTVFASTTIGIPVSGMNVSTTTTSFTILVQPKNSTSMSPGTYIVTSTVAGWIDSKNSVHDGANTTSSVITISDAQPTPSISNVVINGAAAINLIPNATETISVVASTSAGGYPLSFATGTIYRTSLGSGCGANSADCYQIPSSSCSFSGATTTITCSVGIWYFAQSTGNASSSFPSDSWTGAITVTDTNGGVAHATSSAVNVNVLTAINIATPSINYGTVLPGSNTGATDQTVVVQNAGNSSSTLQLSGTAFMNGGNTIPTSSQHFATSSFAFGGSEQQLSGTAAAVSGFLLTVPTSTAVVESTIYWGDSVPSGFATGTYTATTTFIAAFSQ